VTSGKAKVMKWMFKGVKAFSHANLDEYIRVALLEGLLIAGRKTLIMLCLLYGAGYTRPLSITPSLISHYSTPNLAYKFFKLVSEEGRVEWLRKESRTATPPELSSKINTVMDPQLDDRVMFGNRQGYLDKSSEGSGKVFPGEAGKQSDEAVV
nr:hypothetical protein [Tanacetum cinerariifolium]